MVFRVNPWNLKFTPRCPVSFALGQLETRPLFMNIDESWMIHYVMKIRDKNIIFKNLIYSSMENIWTKNISLSQSLWEILEKRSILSVWPNHGATTKQPQRNNLSVKYKLNLATLTNRLHGLIFCYLFIFFPCRVVNCY